MRALARIALAVPIALATVMPAVADEPVDYVPVFKNERTYVHCGADKVTHSAATTFAWNTTAPTAALGPSAGCAHHDSGHASADGVAWTGKHTGNLDQLTVQAFVADAGPVRAGAYPDIFANVVVTIDGVDLIATEAHIVPKVGPNALVRLLEFSVTDIGLVGELDYKEHEVSVTMDSAPYADGDEIIWVQDGSDVGSGVTFSPATLASLKLSAIPPE